VACWWLPALPLQGSKKGRKEKNLKIKIEFKIFSYHDPSFTSGQKTPMTRR
jgi:hypothetical protein